MSERKHFESSFRLRHTDPNLADSLLGFDTKKGCYELGYTQESYLSWQAAKQSVGEWVKCSDRAPTYEDADEGGQVWYSWSADSCIIQSWLTVSEQGREEGVWMARVKNIRPQPPKDQP